MPFSTLTPDLKCFLQQMLKDHFVPHSFASKSVHSCYESLGGTPECISSRIYPWPQLRIFSSFDLVGSTSFKDQFSEAVSLSDDQDDKNSSWLPPFLLLRIESEKLLRKYWENDLPIYQEILGRQSLWPQKPSPIQLQNFIQELQGGKNSRITALVTDPKPRIWKTIGDEVLFVQDISHPAQVLFGILTILNTFRDLRARIKDYSSGRLDLKGTCWAVLFPQENVTYLPSPFHSDNNDSPEDMMNRSMLAPLLKYYFQALAQYQKSDPSLKIDFTPPFMGEPEYLGPHVDFGFRLAASARPGHINLSNRLLYILLRLLGARAEKGAESQILHVDRSGKTKKLGNFFAREISRQLVFRYDGRSAMRGVMSATTYPIISLDTDYEGSGAAAAEEYVSNSRALHGDNMEDINHLYSFSINYAAQNRDKIYINEAMLPPCPHYIIDEENIDGQEIGEQSSVDQNNLQKQRLKLQIMSRKALTKILQLNDK